MKINFYTLKKTTFFITKAIFQLLKKFLKDFYFVVKPAKFVNYNEKSREKVFSVKL